MTAKSGSFSAPADEAAAIVPSDSTVITPTRGIYVGTTGDVVVKMQVTGDTITFKTVPAGSILPIIVTKVYAATTASNLVALY